MCSRQLVVDWYCALILKRLNHGLSVCPVDTLCDIFSAYFNLISPMLTIMKVNLFISDVFLCCKTYFLNLLRL